jgi:hypothetical protein
VAINKVVRELEAKVAADANKPVSTDRPTTAAEVARLSKIKDLRAQLEDIDRQLQDKQRQEQQLRATISEYQAKVDVVPTRESELVELTRDYSTLQQTYATLLGKREDSKLASSLERRQYGEQFRIVDSASLPQKPYNQKIRLEVIAGGAVGGLLLGLLVVGFREYRESGFKNQEDVVRVMSLPVLAIVPVMGSGSAVVNNGNKRTFSLTMMAVFLIGSVIAFTVWTLKS